MARSDPEEKPPHRKARKRTVVGRRIPIKSAPQIHGFTLAEYRRAVRDGELSFWKVGREDSKRPHLYLDNQEIESWIERRRERSAVQS